MQYLTALGAGLLFALGLGLSGMMNPVKVQGFLDILGRWDPSLMLVMGGAVLVTLLAFPLIFRRDKPVFEAQFAIPASNQVDTKLLLGSGLFGIGWAIAGLCPGPALANLASFNPGVVMFVISMLSGFWLYQRIGLFAIQRHSHSAAQLKQETEAFCADQCVVD